MTYAEKLKDDGTWKRCAVCGERTNRPIRAALWHFRPVSGDFRENLRYFRGNIQTFGFLSGLGANLGILFPLWNTLKNWKYRKMRLDIEEPIVGRSLDAK